MPRQTALVKVQPSVMRWIIDSSGWEDEELSKKLNVSTKTLETWKKKNVGIEIKRLEKLSESIKRPLAIFFLQSPPSEPELTDYRKLPSDQTVRLAKTTINSIRTARYLQSVAQKLMKTQEINTKPKITSKISLQSSPENTAKSERKKLGFESEDVLLSPEAKKSIRSFYKVLRRQIESFNIFVFQASMSIQEVRGMTLSDKFPRVIVINSKDSIHAKIFSLLHEYGHILLRKDGICIPQNVFLQNNSSILQTIERWCNGFAAEILMPKDEFLAELNKLENKNYDVKKIVTLLSRKFKTSKHATIIQIKSVNSNFSADYQHF